MTHLQEPIEEVDIKSWLDASSMLNVFLLHSREQYLYLDANNLSLKVYRDIPLVSPVEYANLSSTGKNGRNKSKKPPLPRTQPHADQVDEVPRP